MNINKKLLIKQNQIHELDTGSKKVQVFLIQRKILNLEKHLKVFKQDKDAINALFSLINKKKIALKQIRSFNKVEHDSILLKLEKMKEEVKSLNESEKEALNL